jgi:hypothetical protein
MGLPVEPRKTKEARFIATFIGYFKESVYDAPDENNRLRLLNFNYYFEDDTMEIFEPRTENSAIPQVPPYTLYVCLCVHAHICVGGRENPGGSIWCVYGADGCVSFVG